MNTLAVIPARGGSKGIPHKNLAPLRGRPLIDYTLDAALAASSLSRIVVSTDDSAIADHARAFDGIDLPALRPAHLAQDDTPILPVLLDLLDTFEQQGGSAFDAVVLLQPTSPLRLARDIDAAVALLDGSGADAAVSIQEVPHACNPVSVMTQDASGLLAPFLPGAGYKALRRQDKPNVVARNGPAVLVTRVATLRAGSLYGAKTLGYPMPRARSIDIDEPLDLVLAEALLAERERAAANGGGA